MNATTLPLTAASTRFVPASDESRPVKEYDAEKAFADRAPKLDSKGRQVNQFTGLVEYAGTRLGAVTIESPQPLPEKVPLGAVFVPTGVTTLTIRNNREGFDLKATLQIEGFEVAKG